MCNERPSDAPTDIRPPDKLTLSPPNTFTSPPALTSMSVVDAETLSPAYKDARAAATKFIAIPLKERPSDTSTDADAPTADTDAPEDNDTAPLDSTDADPADPDTTPPTNASTLSDADTDITDAATSAENESIAMDPPET